MAFFPFYLGIHFFVNNVLKSLSCNNLTVDPVSGPVTVVPAPVSESSDEGIGSMSPEPVSMGATGGTTVPSADQDSGTEMLRRELMDLRVHLERERRIRLVLEDQVKSLEGQLYPDRAQLQYQHEVCRCNFVVVTLLQHMICICNM